MHIISEQIIDFWFTDYSTHPYSTRVKKKLKYNAFQWLITCDDVTRL